MFTHQTLLSVIRQGHRDDIQQFDGEFGTDADSFVRHLQRCYLHLQEIIIGPENEKPLHATALVAYLLDASNSLMAAFTTLRYGYPIQALDLARRVIEATSVAVYISDHPQKAQGRELYGISPSRCVAYAKRHMGNVGQAYGFFSQFDHAHSAMLAIHPVFATKGRQPTGDELGFPVGPWSVEHRKPLFALSCLRLLATAHNLEGVVEMLLFWGLKRQPRYWLRAKRGIEYRPIQEEELCASSIASRLDQTNKALQDELKALERKARSV